MNQNIHLSYNALRSKYHIYIKGEYMNHNVIYHQPMILFE